METEEFETSQEFANADSPENPQVEPAKSHHPATATLPGGDKYTRGRVWAKRILAAVVAILFVYLAIYFISTFNIGGIIEAPEPPSAEKVTSDLQAAATAPNYEELKYISETDGGSPTAVENVEVGRVVSATGEGATYACEAKADVSFENGSVGSTSKMRIKYTYNVLMNSWVPGNIEIESSNYHPNGAPNMDKIQDDIMNLMAQYDEDSATAMEGCDISRDGDVGADGGEVTFTCYKAGAGSDVNYSSSYAYSHASTNGKYDLVKTLKVRVKWSETEGWKASIVWMGTQGDYATKTSSNQTATQQLTCTSGSTVQLTGTFSGSTLTLSQVTEFTIDGNKITTSAVTVTGNTGAIQTGTVVYVTGVISSDGTAITLSL